MTLSSEQTLDEPHIKQTLIGNCPAVYLAWGHKHSCTQKLTHLTFSLFLKSFDLKDCV